MVRRMGRRKDFILVGRTSEAIAAGIIDQFGHGGRTADGKPEITRPGPVVQFGVSAFEDGEVNATLFVNGDQPSHPIVQTLNEDQKIDIKQSLEKARVTLVHSASGQNTSMRALGQLFLVKSLYRDYGVDEVRVIAPALPFMRSDRNFSKEDEAGRLRHEYNAVAALHYADLLHQAGVTKVWGFEPHSRDGVDHYKKIFGKNNAQFVNMGDFYADTIRQDYPLKDESGALLVMVGSPDGMNKPDDYGMARARSFGEALFRGTAFEKYGDKKDFHKRPYMFGIHKERINSKETKIVDFHGDVAGKVCFIIDDIISGGSTTLLAAEELKKRGAKTVIAIATHGVLVNGAAEKLTKSRWINGVMLTDTIPGALEKLQENGLADHKKMMVRTIASLVNDIIEKDFHPDKKLVKRYEATKGGLSMPTPQVG